MKLKNAQGGQTVVDKLGNEYVVEIVDSGLLPLKLKCTKFVECIGVQEYGVMLCAVDQSWWIYKSKKAAKKYGVQGSCITVKSLKLKE